MCHLCVQLVSRFFSCSSWTFTDPSLLFPLLFVICLGLSKMLRSRSDVCVALGVVLSIAPCSTFVLQYHSTCTFPNGI